MLTWQAFMHHMSLLLQLLHMSLHRPDCAALHHHRQPHGPASYRRAQGTNFSNFSNYGSYASRCAVPLTSLVTCATEFMLTGLVVCPDQQGVMHNLQVNTG